MQIKISRHKPIYRFLEYADHNAGIKSSSTNIIQIWDMGVSFTPLDQVDSNSTNLLVPMPFIV